MYLAADGLQHNIQHVCATTTQLICSIISTTSRHTKTNNNRLKDNSDLILSLFFCAKTCRKEIYEKLYECLCQIHQLSVAVGAVRARM